MKKNITLFALLCLSTGLWAQTTTATYGKGNGTFYKADGTTVTSSGFDARTFISNTNPAVTVQTSDIVQLNSNDAASEARLGLNNGTNTFTISVPDGYIIESYSFVCWAFNGDHPAKNLTTDYGYTNYEIPKGNTAEHTINVTGINKQSTSFTFTTTGWAPLKTKNFKIYVRKKFYEEEKTSAAELEDGYYIVEGRANGKSGFWYHDLSLGGSRYFRVSSSSSPDLTSFIGNLKYIWKLTKDNEAGTFTLQNIDTNAFAPADQSRNQQFQGSTTANLVWDSDHAAIKQTNYTYSNNDLYVHCNQPNGDLNLSYWNSGSGNSVNSGSGSLLAPRFFLLDGEIVDAIINLRDKIGEVTDFSPFLGDDLNQYTTNATPSAVQTELTNARTLYENTNATKDQMVAEATTLQSYLDNATINIPTAGFYRFKAAARSASDATNNWYMGGDVSSIYSASTTATQATDANTIFYLEKDDDGYHPISYVSGMYSNGTGYNAVGTKSNFTLTQAIKENNTDLLLGEYKLYNTGTSKTIVMWSNSNLNAINGNNDWSGWTIEEVSELPVTISKYGMRTFSAPVALTIPEGVQAFTIEVSGSDVVLTEVSTTIPANTPVVLYSHGVVWENESVTGTDETFNFPIVSANTDAALACELTPTVAAKVKTDNDLTLQYDLTNKVFGFWKAAGTNIKGFSAYLEWNVSYGAVRSFVISMPYSTGIEMIGENPLAGRNIHDVQGRQVNKATKGIYIVNGKKVLF